MYSERSEQTISRRDNRGSSFRSLPLVARTDRTAQREAMAKRSRKEKSDGSGQFLGDAIEPSRALGCIHPFETEPIPTSCIAGMRTGSGRVEGYR